MYADEKDGSMKFRTGSIEIALFLCTPTSGYLWSFGENSDTTIRLRDPGFLKEGYFIDSDAFSCVLPFYSAKKLKLRRVLETLFGAFERRSRVRL